MKQDGFTLIEIIVSLVLVGIITAFAGMGLVQAVESYVFSRDTVALSEKAQLAMTRLVLELKFTESISTANANRMDYTSSRGDGTSTYSLRRNPNNNRILVRESTTNHILIDNLGTYPTGKDFLAYKKDNGALWNTASSIKDLAYIEILLVLKKTDGSDIEYKTILDIRNNKRANAVLPES